MNYHVFHLKDPSSNGPLDILKFIDQRPGPASKQDNNLATYGVFINHFGLATNELYWVLMSNSTPVELEKDIALEGLMVISRHTLIPTVRPTEHNPLTKSGLYVFRWFTVNPDDIDEITNLSRDAWKTFEPGFGVEVQALFAPEQESPSQDTMLLITWYRQFSDWELSRQPDEKARELFIRRHTLTLEATPIATQLYLKQQ